MRALPFIVAAVGIANFTAMDAVMKGQSIAIGALAALFWRSVIGSGACALLYAARGGRLPPAARLRLHAARSGAAAASILLFFWGLARTPMAEAVALTFLAPLIAAFLASALLGERLRAGAVAGSLLALAGVGLIVAIRGGGEAHGDPLGMGAILLASVLYAGNLVMLRRQAQAADPLEITLFTNLVMLGLFAMLVPWFGAWPTASDWWLLPLASALQIVSSTMLAWAYARAQAQSLAVMEYTGFVWAALLGWLAYGERLEAATVAGAALIVAGVVAATRAGRVAAVQTEAAL